ncbi:hypothetical protein HK104_005657 [Borealophlyctis nickersoniae]|nr:hypothetical protein HK104_005657 [Borealophlyctis nickersoniae]
MKSSVELPGVFAKVKFFSARSHDFRVFGKGDIVLEDVSADECEAVVSEELGRVLSVFDKDSARLTICEHGVEHDTIQFSRITPARSVTVIPMIATKLETSGSSVAKPRWPDAEMLRHIFLDRFISPGQIITARWFDARFSFRVKPLESGTTSTTGNAIAKIGPETEVNVALRDPVDIDDHLSRLKDADVWVQDMREMIAGLDDVSYTLVERFTRFLHLSRLRRTRSSNCPIASGVMLSGRSGTGKTILARAFAGTS